MTTLIDRHFDDPSPAMPRMRRAVFEGFEQVLIECASCGEETDVSDLDEIDHTWMQWRCSCCGAWNDNPDAEEGIS